MNAAIKTSCQRTDAGKALVSEQVNNISTQTNIPRGSSAAFYHTPVMSVLWDVNLKTDTSDLIKFYFLRNGQFPVFFFCLSKKVYPFLNSN